MVVLLDLPAEVLIQICTEMGGADDLARFSSTCRSINRVAKGNTLLYKQLYLNRFDDPSDDKTYKLPTDWENEAKHIAITKSLLAAGKEDQLSKHRQLIAETTSRLLRTTNPKNSPNNRDIVSSFFPKDDQTIRSLCCRSSLYARALGFSQQLPRTQEELDRHRASAHLHCLYGKPQLEIENDIHIQPYALSKVYDMRQHIREKNGWGPFLDNASWDVDWEKLEAIMCTLGAAIHEISPSEDSWIAKLWSEPFQGTSAYSYQAMKPRCPHATAAESSNQDSNEAKEKKRKRKLDEQDPYGITGTYLRIVCFLDYRVLYKYNWGDMRPRRIDAPMPIIEEQEATRLIAMSIAVDHIEWPDEDKEEGTDVDPNKAPTHDAKPAAEGNTSKDDETQTEGSTSKDDNVQTGRPVIHTHATRAAEKARREKRRRPRGVPVVHFSGTSRLMHAAWDPHANSRIKGTVRMTSEGEVRWTTTSIFGQNEERWRSEGIQLGGPQSGRGVVGTWFDCRYEAHGPAGPTAFWKIRDEIPEGFFDEDSASTGVGMGDDVDIDSGSEEGLIYVPYDDDDDEGADDSETEALHHALLDEGMTLILTEAPAVD